MKKDPLEEREIQVTKLYESQHNEHQPEEDFAGSLADAPEFSYPNKSQAQLRWYW